MRGTATYTVMQFLFYSRITSYVGLGICVGCAHTDRKGTVWKGSQLSRIIATLKQNGAQNDSQAESYEKKKLWVAMCSAYCNLTQTRYHWSLIFKVDLLSLITWSWELGIWGKHLFQACVAWDSFECSSTPICKLS